MQNLIKYTTALALLLCCWSCGDYEVQYEGPYDPGVVSEREEAPILTFITEGNLYVAPLALLNYRLIDSSGTIESVSINDDHTMLAYKAANSNVRLYDLVEDRPAGLVTGTTNVDWFEWHANNETLYFLEDGVINTFGPDITIAVTDLNTVGWQSTFGKQISTVAVTADGTVIWLASTGGITSQRKTVYFYYPEGPYKEVELQGFSLYQRFRLSHDQTQLWASSENEPSERIDVYNIETTDRLRTLDEIVVGSPGGTDSSSPDIYAERGVLYFNYNPVFLDAGIITDLDN